MPGHAGKRTRERASSLAIGFLTSWRSLLTSVVVVPGRRLLNGVRLVVTSLGDPAAAIRGADDARLLSYRRIGTVCVLGGATFGLLVATAGARPLLGPGLSAAWTLVWAFLRLALLRLMAPAALRDDRPGLAAAWGIGLVPWLLGVTETIRLAVFLTSAWITYRGVRGLGATARRARSMTGVAFGSQAVVQIASWAARAWVLLLLPKAVG